jgi:hypothetical protein
MDDGWLFLRAGSIRNVDLGVGMIGITCSDAAKKVVFTGVAVIIACAISLMKLFMVEEVLQGMAMTLLGHAHD